MELKPGMSALVTGGASGIGKAICLSLAQNGIFVTVIDFSEERGKEVAFLVEKENSKFHNGLKFPPALFIKCDVTNTSDMSTAFKKHLDTYGGLDICVNSAGLGTAVRFDKDDSDGNSTWRRTINVNFVALVDCTRMAIQSMRALKKPGVIINLGSASGLYPMFADPIYAGTKGGVVLFTRSLAPLKREGIRVNVLCPEFVETELGNKVNRGHVEMLGGFLTMDSVMKGVYELIKDESKAGACLWITNRILLLVILQRVVHTHSHKFRSATRIIQTRLSLPIKPQHALVKVIYAGVNASDVNFSSGRYFSNDKNANATRRPFDAGFEDLFDCKHAETWIQH